MNTVAKKSGKSKGAVKRGNSFAHARSAQTKRPVADGMVELPEAEFRSVTSQLKELTHTIVDAWATRGEIDAFEEVLVKLHAARRNLETACRPIEGVS